MLGSGLGARFLSTAGDDSVGQVSVRPNHVSYNSSISACEKAGRWLQAATELNLVLECLDVLILIYSMLGLFVNGHFWGWFEHV